MLIPNVADYFTVNVLFQQLLLLTSMAHPLQINFDEWKFNLVFLVKVIFRYERTPRRNANGLKLTRIRKS